MNFGDALAHLWLGDRVARAGWNGKSMWLKLVGNYTVQQDLQGVRHLSPWIGMKTADECFVPWLASQTDMLANDWVVL